MKKFLLSAVAMIGLMPGFTSTASADLIAEDRSGWTIYGCSNETNEGAGLGTLVAMKDGNASTYWHSCWSVSHNAQNHYFVVDRGEDLASTALDAIGYTPRQNDNEGNGYVTACDVYILDSIEGLSVYSNGWAGVAEGGHDSLSTFIADKTPTAQGTFPYVYNDPSNRAESKVQFEAPVAGRYILFVATATSGSQGDNFANCAEFNAYIEVADITYSDVTFNFPAYGEDSFSLTVNAMDGSDAAKLIPAVDFFTNAAIEGENTIVSPENNTFNVTGTWEFPFTADQVYRIDIRMKNAELSCSNLFYSASANRIQTRNVTDADAFVPERLFYISTNGFDANGHMKATLHTIASDASTGFQVSADNNAVGSVTETPTEFLVVSNGNANETNGAGISLRHSDNNISHINDISGNLGIWSHGNSQDDGGSFLRFFELTDTDFDGLLSGENAAYFTQETIDAAKANHSSANVRAVFASIIASNNAIAEANALISSVSGYTAEHFGEGLGYLSGSTYDAIAALVASLQEALQGGNLETIIAATDALKAELANVKINAPEAGKYYYIKGYEGGYYMAPTSAEGQIAMAQEPNKASAFTFEPIEGSANTFVVKNYYYNTGFIGTYSLGGEETLTLNPSEGGIPGAFTIKSNYSGSQYLYNHYDWGVVNRYSDYNERCNWVIEETVQPSSTAHFDEMVIEMKAKLSMYFSASSEPDFYNDILSQLDWCLTEEELEETYSYLLENAFQWMQSTMEFGATWKNNSTGYFMNGVTAEDNSVSFQLAAEMSVNAFWVAEFIGDNYGTDIGGGSSLSSDRTFYLRNVITNTYVGNQPENGAIVPAVTSKEDAAVLKLVAGANGFEFLITNDGIENNFLNVNSNLVTNQVADDAGAFWSVVALPTFPTDKRAEISFLGEYTEGDWGAIEWSKVTGIQIKVPAGATPTAIGSLRIYHYDNNWNTVDDALYSVASLIEGVTPTQDVISFDAGYYDPNIGEWGEWVEILVDCPVDVYNVTFETPLTDYYYYVGSLSNASFAFTADGATTYNEELYTEADIVKPAEPFNVVIGPEAGIIEELVNITFSHTSNIYENRNCWEAMTLVANGETTIFEIYPSGMYNYNSYDFDVADSPYYTIPVAQAAAEYAASQESEAAEYDATAPGTYTLTVPAEFFANDANDPSIEAIVTWTIEEKDGINEITNITVNGNVIYDLNGRRVANPNKGIYIINGKKTIVK